MKNLADMCPTMPRRHIYVESENPDDEDRYTSWQTLATYLCRVWKILMMRTETQVYKPRRHTVSLLSLENSDEEERYTGQTKAAYMRRVCRILMKRKDIWLDKPRRHICVESVEFWRWGQTKSGQTLAAYLRRVWRILISRGRLAADGTPPAGTGSASAPKIL